MLVLTRKCDESVVIGAAKRFDGSIKVTVIEIRDGKVKLGFEAPDDVPVHRLELWEQMRADGQQSSSVRSLAVPAPR